jgi:hypothetical protein
MDVSSGWQEACQEVTNTSDSPRGVFMFAEDQVGVGYRIDVGSVNG